MAWTTELTEAQLAEAKSVLEARERARVEQANQDRARRQREAEDRFWEGMQAKYPELSRDTMYDIWSEVDAFYR